MAIKFLKSIGLILGTMGALLVGFPGVRTCVVTWIILSGLFLISRFSKRVYFLLNGHGSSSGDNRQCLRDTLYVFVSQPRF